MKLPLLLCLIVVAVSCEEKVSQAPPIGPPHVSTNTPPITSTTPIPSSPPTTLHPTSPSTPITTTKPSTTTITTTKPSTTITTTTTTTPPPTTTKPTTTTLAPPTTPTPPPAPVPEPSTGNWALNYTGTNRSCVLLDVAVQFEIIDGNSTQKYNLPNSSLPSGDCGNKTNQVLALKWTDPATKNLQSLEFAFGLNNSKYDLEEVHLALNFSKSKNDSKTYFLHHHKQEFVTPLHNSYKCVKVQTMNMTDDKNETRAYLHVSHLQLEAFVNVTGRTFSSAKDCSGSVTPDVVPIVVGCVLAALVVMVLVAYLIGRRRCQARGYLSI